MHWGNVVDGRWKRELKVSSLKELRMYLMLARIGRVEMERIERQSANERRGSGSPNLSGSPRSLNDVKPPSKN